MADIETLTKNLNDHYAHTADLIGDLQEADRSHASAITQLTNLTNTLVQNGVNLANNPDILALRQGQQLTSAQVSALAAQLATLAALNNIVAPPVASITGSLFADAIQTSPAIAVETQDNVRLYYALVRRWVLKAKPWTTAIRYQTLPDERHDMTLVSRRVYGRGDEYIAVMAAANLDHVENPLYEQLLTLPPLSVLEGIKKKAGYQNLYANRIF